MKIICLLFVLLSSISADIIVSPYAGVNYDVMLGRDVQWKRLTFGTSIDYNKYIFTPEFVTDYRYGLNDALISGMITVPIKSKFWLTMYGSHATDDSTVFLQKYSYYGKLNVKIYKGFILSAEYEKKIYPHLQLSTIYVNPILYYLNYRFSYSIQLTDLINDKNEIGVGHTSNIDYYVNDDENIGLYFGYTPDYEKVPLGYLKSYVIDVGLKGQIKLVNFYFIPSLGYTNASNSTRTVYEKVNFGLTAKYKFEF